MQESEDYEKKDCQLKDLIESCYDLKVKKIDSLTGWQNLNFKVQTDKGTFVFKTYINLKQLQKVTNTSKTLLFLHQKESSLLKYPKPFPFKDETYVKVIVWNGKKTIFQLLSFVEGTLMDNCEKTSQLLQSLAIFIAELHSNFRDWKHPESYESVWDLTHFKLLYPKIYLVKNPKLKASVQKFFTQYQREINSLYGKLRKSTIHGDLNELNLLTQNGKVTGVIDFGDLVYGQFINELGIALYYLAYDQQNGLNMILQFLSYFQKIMPLTQQELHILFYKIGLRGCIAFIQTIEAKIQDPSNKILDLKFEEKQKMLEKWLSLDPKQVQQKFRNTRKIQ